MTHYRKLLDEVGDRDTIGAWDLTDAKGQPIEAPVIIDAVVKGAVLDPKTSRKKEAYLVTFRGKAKRLVMGPTIGDSIAAVLDSVDTAAWVGKSVTLYPGLTKDPAQEVVECVRVRLTDAQMRSRHIRSRVRAKLIADRKLGGATARVSGDPRGDMPESGGAK